MFDPAGLKFEWERPDGTWKGTVIGVLEGGATMALTVEGEIQGVPYNATILVPVAILCASADKGATFILNLGMA